MFSALNQMSLPIRRCYGSLGGFGLLWAVAVVLAPVPSEARDWVFFFLVFFAAPLAFSWGGSLLPSRFMVGLGVLYCFVVVASHVSPTAEQFRIRLDGMERLAEFSDSIRQGLAFFWAGSVAVLHSVFLFWALKTLAGRQLKFRDLLTLMPLLLLLVGLYDDPGLFFWLSRPEKSNAIFWNAVLVLALAFLLRRLYRAPLAAAPKPGDYVDGLWFGAFLLCLRLPLTQASGSLLHHWSFYVGTIETVKNGGLLLYDTPSQYGFLSIALPAAFPVVSVDAFWFSLMALLTLHFLVVYLSLRNLSLFSGSRLVSGLTALTVTVFLGGLRGNYLGVFEAPSTSAYRFFWSFALALALAHEGLGRHSKTKAGVVSSLFTLGCLWSGESALYCLGVLGGSIAGELLTVVVTHVRKPVAWAWAPLVSLGGAVLLVETVYRVRYGVHPEWRSLFEYSLAYGSGFGSLPVLFFSSGSAILLAFLSGAGLLLAGDFRSTERAGNVFAIWGFFVATFTYFVSRSHPSNTLNLLCYWFPLFLILLNRRPSLAEDKPFRALLYFVVIMLFVWAFPRFPRVGHRLWMLAQVPVAQTMRSVIDGSGPLPSLGLTEHDALVDLSGTLPELSTPSLPFRPFFPVYPALEFLILSPERQSVYFQRFFSRNEKPSVYVLSSSAESPEVARRFSALLEKQGYTGGEERKVSGARVLQKFSTGEK